MLDHLAKQYQNLTSILGGVAVLFILTLGIVSSLGRKKALTKETPANSTVVEPLIEPKAEETSVTKPDSLVISKVVQARSQEVTYSMEEILSPPTAEELAMAEAIAEAGEAALAASIGEPHQAQISFTDEETASWRQAVKESLRRRMQKAEDNSYSTSSKIASIGAIVLYVMAPRSTSYQGLDLLKVLKNQGLTLTDKCIFQMQDVDGSQIKAKSKQDALFYVASAVNPGTFDLNFIHHFTTPGLSFILNLSAVQNPRTAFIKMLNIVSNVAEQLGGDVLDEHRQRLTQAGINEYMIQIKSVENLRKRQNG